MHDRLNQSASFVRIAISILAVCAVLWQATAARAQSQLDYQQRQTFKLADDNLYQVEANLEQVAKDVEAATAKDSSKGQSGINALSKYLKYANDQLAKLPAANPDVQALAKRAAAGAEAIERLKATLSARVSGTQGAANAEADAFEADVDKLTQWGRDFSDPPNLFHRRPDDALLLVRNMANVDAEWKAIQGRWPALLETKNHEPDARKIQAASDFFKRSFTSFQAAVTLQGQELPAETDAMFERVQALLERAVAEKNPLLITNGVAQEIEGIERNVRLFVGINPTAGAAFEKRLNELRVQVKQSQESLREAIIQSNQPPQEQYAGDDVAALRDQVKAKWKQTHPNTEILAVVFNTSGWNRVTRWEWQLHSGATGDITSGSWRKVDYDVIQPKVIIAFDERLAVVYPVDVYKDHMQGGQIAIKPWDMAAEPDVRSMVLLERVPKSSQ